MKFYFPSITGKPNNYLWKKGFSVSRGFSFLGVLFLRYSTKHDEVFKVNKTYEPIESIKSNHPK